MGRTIHVCLSLEGALMNWKKKDYKGAFTDEETGRRLTPEEAKRQIIAWLGEGKKFVPFGECDNFDYSKGCRGHEAGEP